MTFRSDDAIQFMHKSVRLLRSLCFLLLMLSETSAFSLQPAPFQNREGPSLRACRLFKIVGDDVRRL
jgi:hypothetical protein